MNPAQITLCDYFSLAEIELMAKASGFVRRSSPLSGFKFLMTFSLGALAVPDGTLSQFAAYLATAFGVKASPQAVHERIDASAAEFMRLCLAKALAACLRPLPLKRSLVESFNHIYIIDSTNFQLAPALATTFKGPGGAASPAAMRIQLVVDYVTGRLHVEIGDATLNDAPTLERIVASGVLPRDGRCLYLADLGYFKTATYEMISSAESQCFLSKLNFTAPLKNGDGDTIELETVLSDGLDIPVWLGSSNVRLLSRRLPDDVAAARIRKAEESARCKGRGPISAAYRRVLHFAVFVSNLPQGFHMDLMHALYRIRWQIELVFKSWKSILKIHKIIPVCNQIYKGAGRRSAAGLKRAA